MSTDVGNVVSEANEAAAGDGNDGQQDEDSAGIVRTWLRTWVHGNAIPYMRKSNPRC